MGSVHLQASHPLIDFHQVLLSCIYGYCTTFEETVSPDSDYPPPDLTIQATGGYKYKDLEQVYLIKPSHPPITTPTWTF